MGRAVTRFPYTAQAMSSLRLPFVASGLVCVFPYFILCGAKFAKFDQPQVCELVRNHYFNGDPAA